MASENSKASHQSNVVSLRLVKDRISRDTVEALQQLLVLAQRGEVTGIAFACTLRRQRFITDVAGYCYQNPAFARGIVAFLSDELAGIAHRMDEQSAIK